MANPCSPIRKSPRYRFALFCTLACTFSFTGYASAQGVMPLVQYFSFGMVSLGPDQMARLSVVNIAPAGASPACPTEAAFLDSRGGVLKSASASLAAQKSALLDLDGTELTSQTSRVQIRAVFSYTLPVTPGVLAPGSVCTLVPTLEISEKASGKILLVLSDARMVPLQASPPSTLPRR